jgi:hypothetical protein
MLDLFGLAWGKVTPELANDERRIALHVVNHRLATAEDLRLNVAFLRSRVRWFALHLPAGWVQWVRFDDTGQPIPASYRQALREQVVGVERFTFTSEVAV